MDLLMKHVLHVTVDILCAQHRLLANHLKNSVTRFVPTSNTITLFALRPHDTPVKHW